MKGEKTATKTRHQNLGHDTSNRNPSTPASPHTKTRNFILSPLNEKMKKGGPPQNAKTNDENSTNERELKECKTKKGTYPIRNGRMMGR
jgi:hypothetical protein